MAALTACKRLCGTVATQRLHRVGQWLSLRQRAVLSRWTRATAVLIG